MVYITTFLSIIGLHKLHKVKRRKLFMSEIQAETLTVREVAQKLRIGLNQSYEAVRRGDIPAIRIGGRYVIPVKAFEKWLASGGDKCSVKSE